MRKDWDQYFLDIAFQVRDRSTCPRLKVGAVVVKDNRIKGTGYNGSPSKMAHCDDVGCMMRANHCVRTIHAEVNALLECSPEERKGATIYVTAAPVRSAPSSSSTRVLRG
ncbi:MAG TPA: deaminase [Tepidanaerobacteraceae bacterium]|nr:deaminase [Tepidanaerobacteraceae bacterium]